jgi:uncharacterized membrane protein
MRSKTTKPGTATWRLWLGLALACLGILNAVLGLRITSNMMLMSLALSVLMAVVGLIQFSLWSKLRRSLALTRGWFS